MSFGVANNFIALVADSAGENLVKTPSFLVYFVVFERVLLEFLGGQIILNLFQWPFYASQSWFYSCTWFFSSTFTGWNQLSNLSALIELLIDLSIQELIISYCLILDRLTTLLEIMIKRKLAFLDQESAQRVTKFQEGIYLFLWETCCSCVKWDFVWFS